MKSKNEKLICPKCNKSMHLLSTGYSLKTYHCIECKTNTQDEVRKIKTAKREVL
jgi:tRNA(Ile2) C34 agmatinyltransferase TiaS